MLGGRKAIIVDSQDNVATAIESLNAGDEIETEREKVVLLNNIPYGHKFAVAHIPEGEYVIKYGAPIGRAAESILAGAHVHVHNVTDPSDEIRKEA